VFLATKISVKKEKFDLSAFGLPRRRQAGTGRSKEIRGRSKEINHVK